MIHDLRELEPGLYVIIGPMFSGKTTELISSLKKYKIAEYNVLLVKPSLDNRYSEEEVVSHDGLRMKAFRLPLKGAKGELSSYLNHKKYDIIGIDEVQFFDKEFAFYLIELAEEMPVYAAGLNLDFRGEPWESVSILLPYADEIVEKYAICMYRDPVTKKVCGRRATRTQRLINGKPAPYNSPRILIGGRESYEPRCKKHHIVPGRPRNFNLSSLNHSLVYESRRD